jgi:hypothetical protein
MVSIATVGKTSPIRLTRERIAMENCLQQLQNNVGCFVPELSYFKLRQLQMGEGNVIETTERLCRAHQDVVIYIFISSSSDCVQDHSGSTYASISFGAILNQVVERVGVDYYGGEPFSPTIGRVKQF